MKSVHRVLVTGSEGYIGSVLMPILEARGYHADGLDTGFHRAGWLYRPGSDLPRTRMLDTRAVRAADLEGYDAVVHMAELSNDPLGQLAPHITREINHRASVRLAELAREAGVSRFIYMSSCSVYGVASQDEVDETSALNPQTAYAECKAMVERDVAPMASSSFCPVFLRNATAFGASPRMRFDLVLNNLAGLAWTTREIRMVSDGSPWRPLVHIRDIATAIVSALDAPVEAVCGEVFNVGSTRQNYRVREVAEIIAGVFPDCTLTVGEPGGDNRSYRVSFEKITQHLPGFTCEWDAERGARELYHLFAQVGLDDGEFNHRGYTRLKQLEHLIRTQQIDDQFRWRYAA